MHPQLAGNHAFRERFLREAHLGMRLVHPGIVTVHELIADGEVLAIVMELVEGRSLATIIGQETGPIPWVRARSMVDQLLAAVEYAHGQGVIHRDLKPDNVMVGSDGRLRILDFGIARQVGGTGVTQTGTGMGTVDYMAPEQHTDAKSVDERADVYALGMTLYEMLAGRLPWADDLDAVGVLHRKLTGEIPPPTAFYPDIPSQVTSVVMATLATDRGMRIPTVATLRQRLNEPGVRDRSPQPAPSPSPTDSARTGSSSGQTVPPVATPITVEPTTSSSTRRGGEERDGPVVGNKPWGGTWIVIAAAAGLVGLVGLFGLVLLLTKSQPGAQEPVATVAEVPDAVTTPVEPVATPVEASPGEEHYTEGYRLLQEGRAVEAERRLKDCLRVEPDNNECRWELGWALWRQERWTDVLETWRPHIVQGNARYDEAREFSRSAAKKILGQTGTSQEILVRCAPASLKWEGGQVEPDLLGRAVLKATRRSSRKRAAAWCARELGTSAVGLVFETPGDDSAYAGYPDRGMFLAVIGWEGRR